MHTFATTEEQQLLAENLARLLTQEAGLEARHRQPESVHTSSGLWRSLAELGVLGAAFDEASGGFAGDARTIGVVMAELGVGLAFEPFLETAVLAGRVIQRWEDEALRSAALDSIISGQSIVVVATSPSGEPRKPMGVTAAKSHTRVVLGGQVSCVRHATMASKFLVPAVTGDGRLQIYTVPSDCRGLTVEGYRLIDGARGADLIFREVELPLSAASALTADSQAVLDDAIEWGILARVAEMTAIMQALNAATFSYLTTRRQFGAVIGSFQALQHRAADMYIAAETTVALADAAIESFAVGPSAARSALLLAALVTADSAARLIGADAVQLHGGMGVSDELIVSHYARRLLAIRHGLGNPDNHRLRFRSSQ